MSLMKLIPALLAAAFATVGIAAEGDGSLPPNPTPGKCYIHKFYPPMYETTEQTVVIKDAFKTFVVIPAVFKKEQIRVKVRDAFTDFTVVAPEFKRETVRIEILPPDPVWKVDCCPSHGPHHHGKDYKGGGDHKPNSCEQACFKPVTPEYKTIVKEVLVRDGRVDPREVPEEFVTVDFNKLVSPPKAVVTDHPAVTIAVKTKKLVSPGSMKWEEGTCGKYTCDPRDLKAALQMKGYYTGTMDGGITPDVVAAMNKFRADNGLGIHDALDNETALALGITGFEKK